MNKTTSQRILLWSIAIIAVVSIGQIPPISQDVGYHHFADTQTLFGIPNMWNVLSNFPFLLVGLYGLRYALREKSKLQSLYLGAITFSIGIILVAFGSGYYHWQPNNVTLIWDRLPMTIGFMGLYAMVLSAFVREKSGASTLPWLLVAGIVSVAYWAITESMGQGDLRWYALVQFLPIVLTLVILLFFDSKDFNKSKLVAVLAWYSLAKLLEFGDAEILTFTDVISGHSLKHIAAAVACFYVIQWLRASRNQ